MEPGKVISALNSEMRREILKIISEEPMTVIQVLEELKRRRFEVKYRETVYRALEKLLDAGLVEKYYDQEKGLCYRIKAKLIAIDLANSTIETQ
ncbi:MAG: ArsR/SmtB family transcription factor [Thermoproteota archaeon]